MPSQSLQATLPLPVPGLRSAPTGPSLHHRWLGRRVDCDHRCQRLRRYWTGGGDAAPDGFMYMEDSVSSDDVRVMVEDQEVRFSLAGAMSFSYKVTAATEGERTSSTASLRTWVWRSSRFWALSALGSAWCTFQRLPVFLCIIGGPGRRSDCDHRCQRLRRYWAGGGDAAPRVHVHGGLRFPI